MKTVPVLSLVLLSLASAAAAGELADVTGVRGGRARAPHGSRHMIDMPSGGTLSFTYLPDAGVGVEVQGTARGAIPGEDFAQALFRIWLGPSRPNPELKDGLPGRLQDIGS